MPTGALEKSLNSSDTGHNAMSGEPSSRKLICAHSGQIGDSSRPGRSWTIPPQHAEPKSLIGSSVTD